MVKEKTILVFVRYKHKREKMRSSEEEMFQLIRTAGGAITDVVKAGIEKPSASTFVGKGKLEEIQEKVLLHKPRVLIFNIDLTPVQSRNIEENCGVRVVDRTGLILDIFARRATSHAGKVQVELAQLSYLLPRLTGKGVLLSRLGGGIGTRGPGEKKLEIDRRRIRERMDRLKKDLDKLRTHRALLRSRRKKKDFVVVAIVGYTNAGKSTLLNSLTESKVLVEDKLFATLDPRTRILKLARGTKILFTDTVGFLVNLPHSLIESFKATLEEINEADLILHVLDASNPEFLKQNKVVNDVLHEIGVSKKPMLIALNKIDKIAGKEEFRRKAASLPEAPAISAKTGEGLKALITRIEDEVEG